ncbi:hypothetical protein CYMTET_49994 [Cymbomonas tetramitiformis]|uniref:RRM domain-containing protein n=1 Tax=Cymbomonas tetramitiformis TaxID=36881 RepID=A0AAE0BQ87_9CHLO|nr:hypothetical protein CYMTET_49994 [Cymbomonas tetramitiformis]
MVADDRFDISGFSEDEVEEDEAPEEASNAFQKQDAPSENAETKRIRKKKTLSEKELKKANAEYERRGIVYISTVPMFMKPNKMRRLLEPYGEVLRIYLAPEDWDMQKKRKEGGAKKGKTFSEGWVEFTDKKVAKRVAGMLNGQPMGGKHFSKHRYELWSLKYLSKFKWDHLTEEIAYQNAVREQKLAAELRSATRERDFYLKAVDKAHAIDAMESRKSKKVKAADGEDTIEDSGSAEQEPRRVVRHFKQRRDHPDPSSDEAGGLPLSLLAKVFAGGAKDNEMKEADSVRRSTGKSDAPQTADIAQGKKGKTAPGTEVPISAKANSSVKTPKSAKKNSQLGVAPSIAKTKTKRRLTANRVVSDTPRKS